MKVSVCANERKSEMEAMCVRGRDGEESSLQLYKVKVRDCHVYVCVCVCVWQTERTGRGTYKQSDGATNI